MKPDFPITWSLEPWSQSEGLLEIVHAKFQVNAAIFAKLKNVIFAAFYSILIDKTRLSNNLKSWNFVGGQNTS